jgi:Tautomerase enzyme
MPIAHISLRAGKAEAYRQAIFDGIYRPMREALNVPEDDQFMTISEHDPANFRYGMPMASPAARIPSTSRSLCSTPAPLNRRKRCSGGSRSCLAKTLASGPRTCS